MSDPAGGDLLDSAAAGPAAIRGGAVRVAGYVLGVALSLISAALTFRHLGVEDGGRYVTIQSVALLAAGIVDSGLVSIGVREYAVLEERARDEMLRDLLGLRLVLTSLGVLGAVAFSAIAGYGATLVLGTLISGFAVLLIAVQHALGIGLTAQLRLGWVSAADLLRQAVTVAAVVVLVLAGGSLLDFFWVNVVGTAAAVALIAAVTRGTMPLRPAMDLRRSRRLLAETLPYAVATAVGAIYFRLAIILVSLIASAQQTGYFGAAFRGVEVLIAVPGLLVGAVFPVLARAARDDHERLSYALGKIVDVSLVLGLGVALGLGIGAPFVISVVAGPAFAPAADVLRIQGVGLVFSFAAAGFAYAALSLRLHGAVLRANLAALVACLVLVPALTATHRAIGAAVGTTLCEALLAASMALAVRRAGVPLSLDRPGLLRVAGALVIGLLPALLTGLPVAVRTVLCLLAYGAGLLALRALPAELRAYLPGPLRT